MSAKREQVLPQNWDNESQNIPVHIHLPPWPKNPSHASAPSPNPPQRAWCISANYKTPFIDNTNKLEFLDPPAGAVL